MAALFDILPTLDSLNDRDLRTLQEFGVKAGLRLATVASDAERSMEQDLERLRRAALSGFSVFAPDPRRPPGGALETDLQRLPHLLSLPRVVGLGPVGLAPSLKGSAETYLLERVAELGLQLQRPLVVHSAPNADAKAVRRLLAVLRDSAIPPERVLGLGLPKAALLLFRECGHAIGVALGRKLPDRALVETISRFGSERVLLVGNGSDFLALPKAASLLEEAGVPVSVQRRVGFENAMKLFGIEEL